MFQIAERLHLDVTAVERMSVRQVQGWIDFWNAPQQVAAAVPDDDAIQMATLSKHQLRSMFPGRRA